MSTKLTLIVGSTRPVRVGLQLGQQIRDLLATQRPDVDVTIADLAELSLPFLDEPLMPAMGNYQGEHTQRWARLIEGSDAVLFLTPQYNGGYPAGLKNAIDYLFKEWKDKPSLIVSYGGHGGGMAADQLRQVLEFIGADVAGQSVSLTLRQDDYDASWHLGDPVAVVGRFEAELLAGLDVLEERVRAGAGVAAG